MEHRLTGRHRMHERDGVAMVTGNLDSTGGTDVRLVHGESAQQTTEHPPVDFELAEHHAYG